MINCKTNDDFSTKWKLITSKKKYKSVDKLMSNNAFEFISKKIELMTLYYEKRFPEVSIKKIKQSIEKLMFSQIVLIATQNSVSNSLANNMLNAVIQTVITQNFELKLWLKKFFSTYCNTIYAKIKKQTWFHYYINQQSKIMIYWQYKNHEKISKSWRF